VIGAAQGWFVAYSKIPSFIVTLAGMLVFKGLSLALLQGPVDRAVPGRVPAPELGLHPDCSRQPTCAPPR
jgi:putative multiple sugar transport system permease protein